MKKAITVIFFLSFVPLAVLLLSKLFNHDETTKHPSTSSNQSGHPSPAKFQFRRDFRKNAQNQMLKEPANELQEKFRNTPLVKRGKMTWDLALDGDGEDVQMLTNALIAEFQGQSLSREEAEVLFDTVQVLGFLANRSDAAADFLKQGVNFEFWARNAKWTAPPDHDTDRILVSLSIQALGYSGRPEVEDFLRQLTKRDAIYVYRVAGAIPTAIFHNEVTRSSGIEKTLGFQQSDEGFNKYMEWVTKTEEGKKWHEWSDYIKGHRPEGIK